MARIPTYTQRIMLDRSNQSNVESAYIPGAREAARIERQGEVADQQVDLLLKQKDAEGSLAAQEKANAFEREIIEKMDGWRSERQANPSGFAKEADDWFIQRAGQIEGETKGQNVNLDAFRKITDNMRNSVLAKNKDWETDTRVKNTFVGVEQSIEGMNANFAMGNPTFKDLVAQQNKIRDYTNTIGAKILSFPDQVKLANKGIDDANRSFFDQKLQQDPESLKRILEYGDGGKDRLIEFVMNDPGMEGGGRYVKDGGGYAKYGINSVHNPGVDVKNLTPEEARDIYSRKYWDKRLDKYDPAFQAVAFDALVNHGNDKDTWRMIEASNENPFTLIDLRKQKYNDLIAKNPEKYGPAAQGWQRRMDTLTQYVQDLSDGASDYLQSSGIVDPGLISNVRNQLDTAIARKKAQREKEFADSQKADELTQLKNQNDILDSLEKDDLSYDQKMLNINKMELTGQIKQDFAADARRYMESKKALSAVTNSDQMADVVTQMYDLNTIADMNEADYLRGVQNIKRNIMSMRADGTLSREDGEKLENQLRTLTASKQADATNNMAFSFGEANKMIEQALPPELRGKATRELFYAVDQEIKKTGQTDRKTEKALYKSFARKIIDGIQAQRRASALGMLDNANQGFLNDEDKAFAEQSGYALKDVEETAKKYQITPKQVIERLKAKRASNG